MNLSFNKILFVSFLFLLFTAKMYSQRQLIFQPNAKNGKDAVIWYISSEQTHHGDVSNKNYGSDKDVKALAWSFEGNAGEKRSLIKFNLKEIPEDAHIISAYLSLYANRESGDANKKGHTFIYTNSNECLIQRVTEPWDENTVTWNTQPKVTSTNEVVLHKSEYSFQDYENIDITQLVKDILENPDNNFGFMISVKDASLYKCLIFASSDNPNPDLHPKLVVNYTAGKNKNHNSHFNKKKHSKYVIIIYDNEGKEIKRLKKISFDNSVNLESGTYHFNLMKNNNIISAGKFIIY